MIYIDDLLSVLLECSTLRLKKKQHIKMKATLDRQNLNLSICLKIIQNCQIKIKKSIAFHP